MHVHMNPNDCKKSRSLPNDDLPTEWQWNRPSQVWLKSLHFSGNCRDSQDFCCVHIVSRTKYIYNMSGLSEGEIEDIAMIRNTEYITHGLISKHTFAYLSLQESDLYAGFGTKTKHFSLAAEIFLEKNALGK
ncbi:hypothetical protein MAR_013085 [Mya arenaria]|uniref:Uncharacterized protein n=1 Tax=Mya arenaria TaxID=6604 RepID=A0ABY7G2Y6_MYAAR|nr:hypothetical protein MAR_013085 [Mya arenaria]